MKAASNTTTHKSSVLLIFFMYVGLNSTFCSQDCSRAPKGEPTCNTSSRCVGVLSNYTCKGKNPMKTRI